MYNFNLEHGIYFETVNDRYSQTRPDGLDNLYSDFKYILDNYGNHPKFLRIDGKPVIFVYATISMQPASNWSVLVNKLHDNGYNPFLIADIGLVPKEVPPNFIPIFDGFHVYNPFIQYLYDPGDALQSNDNLVTSSRANGKLSCSTVVPGYNDTNARHGVSVLPRFDGEIYRASWDAAIKSKSDWVLICTFNEWHEGTEIETSMEYGSYYTNMTKDYVSQFKS